MKRKANRKRRRSRDQVAAVWFKQSAWLYRLILDLDQSPTGHGLKWTGKMIVHYVNQYKAMRKATPKRCLEQAKAYDLELAELLAKYEPHL